MSIRIEAPVPAERSLNFPIYAFSYDSATQWAVTMPIQYVNQEGCDTGSFSIFPHVMTCVSHVLGPQRDIPVSINTSGSAINQGPNTFMSAQSSVTWVDFNAHYQTCAFTSGLSYEDYYGNQHPLDIISTQYVSNGPNCSQIFGLQDYPFGGDEQYKAIYPTNGAGITFGGLIDIHGNASTLNVQQSVIEDPNGNTRSSTGRSGTYTGFNADALGLYSPPGTTSSSTLTFPGIAGAYTYNYETIQTSYVLQGQDLTSSILGASDTTCGGLEGPTYGSHSAVSSIVLPDGRSYTFTYDPVYGLLKRMTYPSGAWIEYTWAPNSDSEATIWGTPAPGFNYHVDPLKYTGDSRNQQCFFRHDYPALSKRVVSYDGTNIAQQQDFVYSTAWPSPTAMDWTSKTTTVTTTDLVRPNHPQSQTIYTYSPMHVVSSLGDHMGHSSNAVEDTITYKDFNGATLKTTKKTWSSQNQLSGECEISSNGLVSGRFYTYAPYVWRPGSTTSGLGIAPGLNLTNLISDLKEYDYGLVTSSCTLPQTTPTRETLIDYATFANTPLWPQVTDSEYGLQFSPNPIPDRPSRIRIMDHGNLIKETDFGYDESSVSAAPSPLIGHDEQNYAATSSNSRGNLTTVRQKCFVGSLSCSDATTTITYDETGKPTSSKDGLGYLTSYSYADSYTSDGGTPAGNTNTYLTKITRPSTNGVQHVQTFQYGLNAGVLRNITDENGTQSSFGYQDTWNRVTSKNFPDRGSVAITYNDGGPKPSVVTTVATGQPAGPIVTTQWMDAIGHNIQGQLNSDPAGVVSTDFTYDGMGLLYTSSNPYISSSDSTSGTTSFIYDALGRKVIQHQPDNSSLQWCYNGIASASQSNCAANKSGIAAVSWVNYSDEVGNSSQMSTDAFGHLLNVIEPTSASTSYRYDALGDLLQINQLGVSGETPRTRSFTYDSLSRLITASNPETGSICYGLRSGANCVNGYDSNGNLLAKTDTRGVTINYVYDALNRVTNKNSAGTSGVPGFNYTYAYDSSDPNGIGRPWYTTSSSNETEQYYYDALGRMLKKAMYLPSTPRTPTVVTAVYDLAGNLTDLTYPDGRHIKESRDGAGLLTQIADLTQPTDNSNGYSYLTASSYWPNGAPQTVWYGNGAAVGYHLNNRLQIDEISDVRIGTGSYTGGNVLAEKHLCFGPATSPLSSSVAGCPTLANGNNGNILQIRDELTGTRTQTFNYDSLNRLTNFVRADGSMQQTYAYDSFGNMTQTSPGTLQTNLVFNPNNQSVNDDYDAVGNLVAHNNGVFTSAYIYDAENKLVNVNGGAATYSYDANGDRVRKDVSPNWTEYVRFNGQSVAERGSDGAWSDYIYANGQRIARADGYDIRIHMSGTNCSNCGSNPNMFAGVTSLTAANGYTIRNGDILAWRQYQDGSTTGGLYLIFTDGTDGLAKRDTDGQLLDQDTTMNAWHMRIVDLTQFAGKTVQLIDPFQWTSAPAGNWDIYYGDIVLTSADGTSIPIYSRTMTTLSPATNPSISNFSAITEKVSDNTPLTTTTYYHGDQVGSTHLLTSGGGWPISSDTYYPFGAEAGPAGDANHYKFTGKERDSESGLDYFGARYYTSTMGRWMSPDWAAKPEAVPYSSLDNPQSLNLYGYVLNNPLSHADADGHCCESDFNSFSDHPGSFTGSSGGDGAIFAPIKQFMADHPVLTNLGINLGLAIITRGEGGEVGMPRLTEGGEAVPSAPSMGAAQRQAMQDQGIPTSQQPTTQTNTPAGKQYTYEVPKPGGGTETKVVQRNTGTDSSHPGQPHVEAGSPKPNGQTDSIGRPRLDSNKTKVNVKKPDGQ